jgi:hypothetical protein
MYLHGAKPNFSFILEPSYGDIPIKAVSRFLRSSNQTHQPTYDHRSLIDYYYFRLHIIKTKHHI